MNERVDLPKAITFGAKVHLKNEVLKDVKIRQWEFSGVEKGKIVLYRREGLILEAGLQDIVWECANDRGLSKKISVL